MKPLPVDLARIVDEIRPAHTPPPIVIVAGLLAFTYGMALCGAALVLVR